MLNINRTVQEELNKILNKKDKTLDKEDEAYSSKKLIGGY